MSAGQDMGEGVGVGLGVRFARLGVYYDGVKLYV